MYYSVSDTGILGKKEIRVFLSGVKPKTFRLLLPLSYRILVGAKELSGRASELVIGIS